MADAAARREARRRRILENSESRLQAITGQNSITNDNLSETVDAAKVAEKLETPSLSLKINGSIPSVSPVNTWDIRSGFQEDFPLTSEENLFPSNPPITQPNITRRRNFEYNPNGEIQGHVHNEDRSNGETSNPFFKNGENNSRNSINPEDLKGSTLITFFASRWVYVLLAAVINMMIVLEAEYLFGTSIIVPFLLLFISRILFFNKQQDLQSGSLLFAALILCNIRPDIIHRLRVSSALLSRIFSEFLFYLFSFVSIYYFFTSYWFNFDTSTPSKAKVIVDHQTEL